MKKFLGLLLSMMLLVSISVWSQSYSLPDFETGYEYSLPDFDVGIQTVNYTESFAGITTMYSGTETILQFEGWCPVSGGEFTVNSNIYDIYVFDSYVEVPGYLIFNEWDALPVDNSNLYPEPIYKTNIGFNLDSFQEPLIDYGW